MLAPSSPGMSIKTLTVLSNVSVSNSESRWMKHFIGTNLKKKCLRFASLLYVDSERWLS